MNLTKNMKSLLIALPLVALAACSSTEDNGTSQNGNGGLSGGMSMENQAEVLAQLRQANTFYFQFDDYQIAPQYQDILSAHAAFLTTFPNQSITIEGHADERGTPEYNIALGQRRAAAIANYLRSSGVSASQISIVSYGEERPLVLESSESAYSKNRRAVILY